MSAAIRLQQLHDMQRAMGMEPRKDSHLTTQWVEGNADPVYETVTDVAHELVFVDYIYQHTLYGEVIEESMRLLAEWVRAEFRIPWTQTWELVRWYAPTMLKLYFLRRSGHHFFTHTLSSKCSPAA